jgi:RNA recognition motif-containing protein
MDIYVGNLPYGCKDSDLKDLFEQYGEVASARVIMDRETNRSKGFGFVGMPNNDEAQNAIDGTNDSDFMGRSMRVNEAQARQERPRQERSARW